MFKNKFLIITLLLVIILSIMAPIVRAENETDIPPATVISAPIEEIENDSNEDSDVTSVQEDDGFVKSDVHLIGNEVTVDYVIDGNLFVIANTVTIDSQIGGDAFIIARNINVTENGYIYSNLFAVSLELSINGMVYDVYATSDTATINGYVYRDLRINCNTLNLFGAVGRNAFVSSNNINFTNILANDAEQTRILGNLNYSSSEELSIPENIVLGDVNYTKATAFSIQKDIQFYVLDLASFVCLVVFIWLISLWIAPKFLEKTNTLICKKLLPVIGLGFLTPILLLVLPIILIVLNVTATVGILMLSFLFLTIALGTSIFIITINNLICSKLNLEKTLAKFGMLVAVSIIMWLIALIPYVGIFINFATVILGIGILTAGLILKDKTVKDKTISE